MFNLIVLLGFSESSARDQTKCLFLNDKSSMVRPILIDKNPVELKYYPFMIIIDKLTGSSNVLSPKICVPKETKGIYVQEFNMITNKDEAEALVKHLSCNCKCKFNSKTCKSNQKWNYKTFQFECKSYCKWKKYYIWNPNIFVRVVSI